MMKSGVLLEPFQTSYASNIVILHVSDGILLDHDEEKQRRKTKIVISSNEEGDIDSFRNKPSIQRGAGSDKEIWNINNINVATILLHIESIK